MNDKKSIIVACGGTGGHVFPGLAVAHELKNRGHSVEVWFSGRPIETAAHKGWDGPTFSTGVRQLSLRNIPNLARSFFKCLHAMKMRKPDVVLAMGSYSSLSPVLAARLCGVPIVLHEANAVPGKAVEVLSHFAHTVATSFDETAEWLPGRQVVKTGLPVRESLADQPRFAEVPEGIFTLFITGGSQGAHRINELTAQAMCLLKQDGINDFFVIHQTGAADEAKIRDLYEKNSVPSLVSAFITDMGRAYATADLVISRAGASTCFELCLVAKPALLIPLPSAIRNHQHVNATTLVKCGGADEGIQRELTGRSINRYILNKKKSPDVLKRMSDALKAIAVKGAAGRVADVLESL